MQHFPTARGEILAALLARRPQLVARGVRRAGVFGSVARGDAGRGSDIDVVVILDDAADRSMMALGGIAYEVEEALATRDFDLAALDLLKPAIRAEVEREAVYAF